MRLRFVVVLTKKEAEVMKSQPDMREGLELNNAIVAETLRTRLGKEVETAIEEETT